MCDDDIGLKRNNNHNNHNSNRIYTDGDNGRLNMGMDKLDNKIKN